DEVDGHAFRDGERRRTREPVADDEAAAPVRIEELRTAGREVDDGQLQLREPLRPERPRAIGGRRRAQDERAVAWREGEKEREEEQRVAVVVVARAIAEKDEDADGRAREERFSRASARDDEHGERELDG